MQRAPLTADREVIRIGLYAALLIASLFVSVPARDRYASQAAALAAEQAEQQRLKAAPSVEASAVRHAATESPDEPSAFLAEILRLARGSGCRMGGYTVVQIPPSADAAAGGAARAEPIKTLRTQVSLICDYPHLREFIDRLRHAPRDYGVVELSVRARSTGLLRADTGGTALEAAVVIDRYVITRQNAPTGPSSTPEQG
jgi:hypothetical protein